MLLCRISFTPSSPCYGPFSPLQNNNVQISPVINKIYSVSAINKTFQLITWCCITLAQPKNALNVSSLRIRPSRTALPRPPQHFKMRCKLRCRASKISNKLRKLQVLRSAEEYYLKHASQGRSHLHKLAVSLYYKLYKVICLAQSLLN